MAHLARLHRPGLEATGWGELRKSRRINMGLKNTDGRKCMQPIGKTGGPPERSGKPGSNKDRTEGHTKQTVGIDSQGHGNTAQGMKKSGGNTSVGTPTLNR